MHKYYCKDCKHEFEFPEAIDVKTTKCLNCGKIKLVKEWNALGIHFKGNGFTKKIR